MSKCLIVFSTLLLALSSVATVSCTMEHHETEPCVLLAKSTTVGSWQVKPRAYHARPPFSSQYQSSYSYIILFGSSELHQLEAMAMLHSVTFVLGVLVAAVLLNLPTLELVSGLYLCPPAITTLGTMGPCMPSVEGAYPDPPTDDCCYVVRSTEPGCLCMAFSGYKNSRSINEKAALNLPHLCGRAVPVNFTCNGMSFRLLPQRQRILQL